MEAALSYTEKEESAVKVPGRDSDSVLMSQAMEENRRGH